jgi:hypothetical protein
MSSYSSIALEQDLNFFEAQILRIGLPRTPWERGMAHVFGALAEQTRRELDRGAAIHTATHRTSDN